ncbi:hypothetical protein HAX54_034957, partial [Datura stramonium]|nr:hypothetical protein [Datura stramonium]
MELADGETQLPLFPSIRSTIDDQVEPDIMTTRISSSRGAASSPKGNCLSSYSSAGCHYWGKKTSINFGILIIVKLGLQLFGKS